ncbi:MAG: hypothetical protein H7251_14720 [Acetobacteraceae bacterium]|nr:hypothetical protein [Acetobacteraceae bacterium]
MFSHPAVIVHGIDHVRLALRPGRKVVLVSSHGAALYAGTGWWRALMAIGRAEFPATPMTDLLDCAGAPGRALEALRAGQAAIRLDASVPAWPAVAAIATALGARVFPHRPPAIDLGQGDAWRLDAWLTGDTDRNLR